MRLREKVPFRETLSGIGDKPMKHAIRISILMFGLVGTFVAASVQQVPALDGGPIHSVPTHINQRLCPYNLATAVEPGSERPQGH